MATDRTAQVALRRMRGTSRRPRRAPLDAGQQSFLFNVYRTRRRGSPADHTIAQGQTKEPVRWPRTARRKSRGAECAAQVAGRGDKSQAAASAAGRGAANALIQCIQQPA